jgi:DNA-binding CsgD family transcriptional regulator
MRPGSEPSSLNGFASGSSTSGESATGGGASAASPPSTTRSTSEIGSVLDWEALPSRTRTVAWMVAAGFHHMEIATELNLSLNTVARLVAELREEMIRQALERRSQLSPSVRTKVEAMRAGTNGAAPPDG